jgi:conjugative transfer pilus assembly protein TraH
MTGMPEPAAFRCALRRALRRVLRRTLLPLTACAWLGLMPSALAENLNAQAQNMFNDLGAVGNLTPPQAFRGQAMNTYTGGSLYVRTPTKNYQLANIQAPYIRAGCGGIDAFGGSFSHISSAQFKQMLKNITSAIPGVLFQMMIDSVEPLLGAEMKWFKQAEQFINGLNMNSCSAATTIAKGIVKEGALSQKACETAATLLGRAADAAEARELCKNSAGVQSVNAEAKANAATKDLPPFTGNLVWEILKKTHPGLDKEDIELIMSMTGTTIYSDALDGAAMPVHIQPTITSIADLLYGNTDNTGSPTGWVSVALVKCPTSDTLSGPCLIPPTQPRTNESMLAVSERTRALMQSISAKIAAGNLAPSTAEQSFINAVPMPIYQLLATSNAINNTNISDAKIGQYAEYAAVEFAHGLLSRAAGLGARGTAYRDAQLSPNQLEQLAMHREAARLLMQTLENNRAEAHSKAQAFVAIVQDIEQLKRSMRKHMSQQMTDVMRFAGTNR